MLKLKKNQLIESWNSTLKSENKESNCFFRWFFVSWTRALRYWHLGNDPQPHQRSTRNHGCWSVFLFHWFQSTARDLHLYPCYPCFDRYHWRPLFLIAPKLMTWCLDCTVALIPSWKPCPVHAGLSFRTDQHGLERTFVMFLVTQRKCPHDELGFMQITSVNEPCCHLNPDEILLRRLGAKNWNVCCHVGPSR